MKPYYEDGAVTIYHGDCRDVLPYVAADVVVTDPPYGVGVDYGTFHDTPEMLASLVADVFPIMQKVGRVGLTPGIGNERLYPQPDWTLAWFYGGGSNYSPWGFNCWQPILVWGKCPYMAAGDGCRPDAVVMNLPAVANGHPCSKPFRFMTWLVNRLSRCHEIVLDPFMGSGTTLRAAKDLGRKAIGIEIEERYCEIAARRCSQETMAL